MGLSLKRKDKEMIEQGGTCQEMPGDLRQAIAEGLGEGWRYFGGCPLYLDQQSLSAGLLILHALKVIGAIEDWKLQRPLNGEGGNPLPEVDLYIKKRNRP